MVTQYDDGYFINGVFHKGNYACNELSKQPTTSNFKISMTAGDKPVTTSDLDNVIDRLQRDMVYDYDLKPINIDIVKPQCACTSCHDHIEVVHPVDTPYSRLLLIGIMLCIVVIVAFMVGVSL